jgi:hypothetical protein
MSRPRTRPITAVVFLAACALHVAQPPRPASAQERGVAPDELTQAILRYVFRYDGGNVRLLEGRIPDDLAPNFYVPPGTRVLGSVVMGSGVLVLAKSGAPPESLRAEYTHALGPRGWTPLEVNVGGGSSTLRSICHSFCAATARSSTFSTHVTGPDRTTCFCTTGTERDRASGPHHRRSERCRSRPSHHCTHHPARAVRPGRDAFRRGAEARRRAR